MRTNMNLNTKDVRDVNYQNLINVLKDVAGLSETDIEVYKTLLRVFNEKGEPLTVNEIATLIKKSRSTVERSLMKLLDLKLVERRVALARSGGYTYVYYPKPVEEMKERLLEMLRNYYERAKILISNIETYIAPAAAAVTV